MSELEHFGDYNRTSREYNDPVGLNGVPHTATSEALIRDKIPEAQQGRT
jgi:hypothetical protein